jgi:superfamily I DNA and RNA helicase
MTEPLHPDGKHKGHHGRPHSERGKSAIAAAREDSIQNMSVEIIRSHMSKPAAMERLVAAFNDAALSEGTLWVGFPLLSDSMSTYSVDALFLSRQHGIVIFDVVEGQELGNFSARQDDLSRLVQAKLLREKSLSRKGVLLVPSTASTFAPALLPAEVATARQEEPDYDLLTVNDVQSHLASIRRDSPVDDTLVERAKSALQNMSNLRKKSFRRQVDRPDSRGAKLQRLEESIATLDKSQTEAVLQVPDGVQRIRGALQ